MPEPLVPPESQYCDANGVPYAGGTIETYIPGTSTLKNTWTDLAGTALNTNPIVLDAAGRALIYGNGEYRFVVRDAAGNLIYDQVTTSFISDAMKAFVQAGSLSEAQALLGVADTVQTETDRATSAESALTLDINAETTRAEAAETNLSTAITEVKNQVGLGGYWLLEAGFVVTSSAGSASVTFSQPFTGAPYVFATAVYSGPVVITVSGASTGGVTIYASIGGTPGAIGVNWFAYGH